MQFSPFDYFSSKALLCSFFCPLHMDAFYLPLKAQYVHWFFIFIFLIIHFPPLKNGSKMKISKNLELSRLPKTRNFHFLMVRISHLSTKYHFFHTQGLWLEVIYNDFPNLDVFHDFKKGLYGPVRVFWSNHTYGWRWRQKRDKTTCSCCQHNGPYTIMGMLWYWNIWNVGKEKRFVYCCQFLGLKFLFIQRFFKINSLCRKIWS